ncbi:MAG: hypothetical protein L0216_02240 [Planctomycetales bacterium]|nr:hypothetical protein [Planctomycetales bacterium]
MTAEAPDPRAVEALQAARSCAGASLLLAFLSLYVTPLATATLCRALWAGGPPLAATIVIPAVATLAIVANLLWASLRIHFGVAGGSAGIGLEPARAAALRGEARSGGLVARGLLLGAVGAGIGALPPLLLALDTAGAAAGWPRFHVRLAAVVALVYLTIGAGHGASWKRYRRLLHALPAAPESRLPADVSSGLPQEMVRTAREWAEGCGKLAVLVLLLGNLMGPVALTVVLIEKGLVDLPLIAALAAVTVGTSLVAVGRHAIYKGLAGEAARIAGGLRLMALGGLFGSLPLVGAGLDLLAEARLLDRALVPEAARDSGLWWALFMSPFVLGAVCPGLTLILHGRALREAAITPGESSARSAP